MKGKRNCTKYLSLVFWSLLLIGLSPVLAEVSEPLILKIPSEVELTKDTYTIADLGTMSGGTKAERLALNEIKLGAAPLPGQQRILTKNYLQSLVQARGFQRLPKILMQETVIVRTASVKITKDEIAQIITEKFKTLPTLAERRDLELLNVPEIVWLTKGEWRAEVEIAGNVPTIGNILFRVNFIRGSEVLRVLHVNGKISAVGRIWRVKGNLPRYTNLTAENFERIEQPLKSGDEYLGEIEGYRNIGQLRDGDILKKRHLQQQPLVNKNSMVTVTVIDGAVKIEMQALAENDGWLGDYVRLKNNDSKKGFSGQVIGKNAVEVLLK